MYEAGHDEVAIARHSNHAQSSVGKYIRDYERVKLLLTQRIPVAQINHLSQMRPNVVHAYRDWVYEYHPELQAETGPPPQPESPPAI